MNGDMRGRDAHRPDVYLDIDEIVLHGVDVGDVAAFRAELVAELTGLATGHRGDYPAGRAYELRGSPVHQATGTPGDPTGHPAGDGFAARVARSAWSSMIPTAVATPTRGGAPTGTAEGLT